MALSKLLGLLFCNLLWSASYSISKTMMSRFHPMEIAFLRFFTGGVPLLLYCLFTRPEGASRTWLSGWARDLRRVDLRIVLVGALTFFMSPLCQMTGLNLSRAMDSSLLIATEPLFTIVIACIMLDEKLTAGQLVPIGLALAGAAVVTELTLQKIVAFKDARLVGNAIFLCSMLSEAAYSALAKPALERRHPVLFMTLSLWVGVILLFAYNMTFDDPARLSGLEPLFHSPHLGDWAAVLYLGLGCTLFAYLYWMLALTDTPVSLMALTLYLQPVLGVVWGNVALSEPITFTTLAGGMLILSALWLGTRPQRG